MSELKVHLSRASWVAAGYSEQAEESWEREGIIPHVEKSCNGLMLKVGQEHRLTSDAGKVTCKNCLKKAG